MGSVELIERVKAGDQAAFEALVVAHHRRLFVLAHGILRDPHRAEDATQQAFVDIWRDIGRLRDPALFDAWSYRLLVRVCYREAREDRARRSLTRTLSAGTWSAPDDSRSVLDRDELERAFSRLSVEHRVVIAMRFLLDLTPDEIGETLGLSRRTVYSRLKRALRAMQAAVEADARLPGAAYGHPEVPR